MEWGVEERVVENRENRNEVEYEDIKLKKNV